MPEKVNSYVKQRVVTVREMNGGTLRFRSPCLWLRQSQGCLGNVSLCILCRGFFFLSVSKHLLFINHRGSAWCFMGKYRKRFLPWGAYTGCSRCRGHARGQPGGQRCRQGCCRSPAPGPAAPICPHSPRWPWQGRAQINQASSVTLGCCHFHTAYAESTS